MPVKRKSPKARRAPIAAQPAAKRVVKLRKPAAKPAAKRVAKPAARPGAKRIAKPAAKPLERPARRLKPPTDRALIEQLTAEVAIVNSIQQGMAGGLDFQGIIDLVGDKLRELLATDDMGIIWLDREAARNLERLSKDSGMTPSSSFRKCALQNRTEYWILVCYVIEARFWKPCERAHPASVAAIGY